MPNKIEIGIAIKKARKDRGLSAITLAKLANVAQSSLSDWENGKTQPSADALFKMCDAMGITPSQLFNIEEEPNNIPVSAVPIKKFKVPVIGSVACGNPIFAEEDFECYVDAINNLHCDFALWAKGDSMINARIHDGDLVFVRKQDQVENGEIAVVLIEDEATLKRVFYDEKKATLTLVAENPKYPPFVYQGEELVNIKIIGKAVAFQSNIR
jgi:repressor LexA